MPFHNIKLKNGPSVLILLLSIACFILFYNFLTGAEYLLFKDLGSDSYNSVYPFYKLIIDTIAKDGIPRWSFQQGLGDNVASFNIGNPFNWFIYLLGSKALPYSIGLTGCFIFIASGLMFYAYLRLLKISSTVCLLGGLIYGLSGYLCITAGWVVFLSYWAFLLAFWLYSLQQLLNGKWYYFPIAVFLTGIDQPFNLYILGEVTLVYLYIWFCINESDFKYKASLFLKILINGTIGLLLGSVFLVGNLLTIMNSPRGSGELSYFDKLSNIPFFETVPSIETGTIVSRFFGNNLLGASASYQGTSNYFEAPILYIGLFTLLLFPQIFVFTKKNLRKSLIVVSVIIIVLLFFPFFRYAFWAFTGSYYRILGLIVSVALLIASLFVFTKIENKQKINVILLIATYLFWVILLFAKYDQNMEFVAMEKFKALFVLTLFLFLILAYNSSNRIIFIQLIILVAFFDAIEVAHTTINKRDKVTSVEWNSKAGYFDHTIAAVKFIDTIDSGFYRIEKNFSSGLSNYASFNDPMVQGYKGTTEYTSFNNKNHVNFMIGMGVINQTEEIETRWLFGLREMPITLGNLAVKYYITKNNFILKEAGLEFIKNIGDLNIYKIPFSIPLGSTFAKYQLESTFGKLQKKQREYALYKSIVIADSDVQKFKTMQQLPNTTYNLNIDQLKYDSDLLKKEKLAITSFSNNQIKGKIEVKQTKLLYFSIPYDIGWHYMANGVELEKIKVNFGMTGLLLAPGKYEILAEYRIPYLKWTIIATLLGICLYLGLIFWRKSQKMN
jgi:uncharacterized membrane protein YfhO